MAYTLSERKLLSLAGQQFRTVDELAGYMRELLETSWEAFAKLCYKLVDRDGDLDTQLEMWLIAIGKKKELENWRALTREQGE
jgi:hypothetical protein